MCKRQQTEALHNHHIQLKQDVSTKPVNSMSVSKRLQQFMAKLFLKVSWKLRNGGKGREAKDLFELKHLLY